MTKKDILNMLKDLPDSAEIILNIGNKKMHIAESHRGSLVAIDDNAIIINFNEVE